MEKVITLAMTNDLFMNIKFSAKYLNIPASALIRQAVTEFLIKRDSYVYVPEEEKEVAK